jgi:hypothetical protein
MSTPSADEMRQLVQQGKAMPAPEQERPGRFQIRNGDDLASAIRAVGRVRPNTDAARGTVRRFIIKRARELNMSGRIPSSWNADGSVKP